MQLSLFTVFWLVVTRSGKRAARPKGSAILSYSGVVCVLFPNHRSTRAVSFVPVVLFGAYAGLSRFPRIPELLAAESSEASARLAYTSPALVSMVTAETAENRGTFPPLFLKQRYNLYLEYANIFATKYTLFYRERGFRG